MIKENEPPDPLIFSEVVNAYERNAALRVAIDLGLFSAIGLGKESPSALARRCHAAGGGIRILCNYLVALGIVQKVGHDYRLTPLSACFQHKDSPAHLVGVDSPGKSERALDSEVAQPGGTASIGGGGVNYRDPIWVEFFRSVPQTIMPAVECIANVVSERFPQARRVLDLAAGHGLFGIHIGKKIPEAEIFALDWPNVLALAEENACAAGIAPSRYHLLPCHAFDTKYPDSCDIVLVTNQLHHFELASGGRLLDRIYTTLRTGGAVITLESIPNPDRVSPSVAATFGLRMLGLTLGGYTFEQLDLLFTSHCFYMNELVTIPGSRRRLVISHKASEELTRVPQ